MKLLAKNDAQEHTHTHTHTIPHSSVSL